MTLATFPQASELQPHMSVDKTQSRYGGIADKAMFKSGRKRFMFKFGFDRRYRGENQLAPEVVAYRLAKAIGASTPDMRVMRLPIERRGKVQHKRGILYEMIPGAKTPASRSDYDTLRLNMFTPSLCRELVRQVVLDYLLADTDRHCLNYIVAKDTLYGIDRGFAFRGDGTLSTPDDSIRGWSLAGLMWEQDFVRFLELVTPDDFRSVLDKVDAISDDEYRRIVGRRHATDSTFERKHNCREGFSDLMRERVRYYVNKRSAIPQVWVDWFNEGGKF